MVAANPTKTAPAIQIIELDGKWYASSPHNGWYLLVPASESLEGSCECPHWRFRLAGSGLPCKHLEALAAYLIERESCPVCKGSGVKVVDVLNPFNMRVSKQARPCIGCLGEKTRAAWLEMESLKESEEPSEPADALDGWRKMTEDERKAVFA